MVITHCTEPSFCFRLKCCVTPAIVVSITNLWLSVMHESGCSGLLSNAVKTNPGIVELTNAALHV